MKKFFKTACFSFIIIVLSITVLMGSIYIIVNHKTEKNIYFSTVDSASYENLPVVKISTNNNQLPKDKENYVNCGFSISNCENEDWNCSIEIKKSLNEENSVGFKLRGNSTLNMPKKPYRIKFDKKQSLFGLEPNKNWVLLADYIDSSKIRNYTAFQLSSKFQSLAFTPSPHHVVLFINDIYQGLYLLTEHVDEKEGRCNIEEDIDPNIQTEFPFLVEMDSLALNEGITGIDNFQTEYYYPIEIKYPEYKDRNLTDKNDVVFNYIQEYMNAVFKTLKRNEKVNVSFRSDPVDFEDLVDVDSFLEFWLINEIMHNSDSSWKSIKMSKTMDGKLKFGPVWDFDGSIGNWYGKPPESSDISCADEILIMSLKTPVRDFVQDYDNFKLLCDKWDDVKENILLTVEELKDYKKTILNPAKFDADYWYGDNGAYMFDMQYDYVRLFLLDRYNFLDKELNYENHSNFIISEE